MRLARTALLAGLMLLLSCAAAEAQPVLTLIGFDPPEAVSNRGSAVIRFNVTNTPANRVDVTFFRDDGASTLVAGLTPGTGPFSVTVPLPRGVDGRQVTFTGIAQDTVTGQLAAGDRQLTIVADDTPPQPPNIISPTFPATVNTDILTIQGTVARADGTPETSGTVLITRIDPPNAGSTIGAGAIRSDGAFTATADLSSFTTGVPGNIGLRAEDGVGNASTTIQRQVTKAAVQEPALQNLTMDPPAGTLTNNPAVLIRGTVTGTNGPFTVSFLVDGFVESQVTGLVNNQTFSHTLTLASDGVHNIQVRAQNSSSPPASGTPVDLGNITLDRTDPAAPVIIEPNPAGPTPVVTSGGFLVRGFSGERAPSTTSTALPVVLISGPPNVSFSPGSPLAIDQSTGQFQTQVNIQNLDDGQHRITFAVRDAAGNSGPGSATDVVFIKDTRQPIIEEIRVNGVVAPQTNPEIFVGQGQVNIQIRVSEELVNVPRLDVTQAGGSTIPAGVSSNTAQVFNYVYGPLPGFDGPVQLAVSGGRDRGGNELNETRTRVFIVDTVPPTVTSVDPADGTTLSTSPLRIRVTFNDPPSSAGTAAGIDLVRSQITLTGPLGSQSQTIPGTQTPFDPQTLDFFLSQPLTRDGTYRIRVTAVDKVSNRTENFNSIFILDATAIVPSEQNVFLTPLAGTCVNAQTIPGTSAAPFVEVRITDPQVDLARTTVRVRDFCRVPPDVAGTTSVVSADTIRFTFAGPLATDGSQDGVYNVAVVLRDQAGNISPEFSLNFTYDTLIPSVESTFPVSGSAVTGPLRAVDAMLLDPTFDNCRQKCGIDRTASSTQIALFLIQPNSRTSRRRDVALPFRIPSTLRFISVGNFDKVLLEILDPGLQRDGLLTDGTDDGVYRLEVTAIDGAGNRSPLTSATFNFDNLQPDLRLNNVSDEIFLTGSSFTVTGSSADNPEGSGVDRVTFTLQSVDADGELTTAVPVFRDQLAALDPATPGVANERRNFTFTGDLRGVTEPTRALLTIRSFDRAGNAKEAAFLVNLRTSNLRPPELSAPASGSSTSSPIVRFSWLAVPGAANYRIRIRGPNQDELLFFSDGATSFSLNLAPLTMGDGTYFWAVASIDALGQQGLFSPNRTFVLDREKPRVVAVDIIDPSPEAVGSINEGEVRFTIRFSEPMDTRFALAPRIRPANRQAPFLDVTQTTFDGNIWTGRATIPESASDGSDFNGLAELEVLGVRNGAGNEAFPRDRAGNRLEAPPLALLVFEIDTGPFFRVSIFQNPVDRKDVILVVKGFVRDGGPPERIDESITVVVRRTGTSDQTPAMRRLNESSFRGTFRVDTSSAQPVNLEVTGRDQQGNSVTRFITLAVTRLSPASAGILISSGGSVQLKTAAQSISEETLIMVPAKGHDLMQAADLESKPDAETGLVPVGQLEQFYPSGLTFRKTAELSVDLAKLAGTVPAEQRAKAGLYELVDGSWKLAPSRIEDGRLVASVGSTGPFGLFADVAPPAITDLEPGPGEQTDTSRPVIRARVRDAGSGVDPASVAVVLEGERHPARLDTESGELSWQAESALAAGSHSFEVVARDLAGNETATVSRLVAPPEFGLAELVAYPNPARRTSTLRYRLNQTADSVRIRIYDMSGRRVASFAGPSGAGLQEVPWPLVTDSGDEVASGVYAVRVEAKQGPQRAVERFKVAVLR